MNLDFKHHLKEPNNAFQESAKVERRLATWKMYFPPLSELQIWVNGAEINRKYWWRPILIRVSGLKTDEEKNGDRNEDKSIEGGEGKESACGLHFSS